MNYRLFFILMGFLFHFNVKSQSIEIMPGNNFVFADIQLLQPLVENYRTSIFNRSYIRAFYEKAPDRLDYLSATYFNVTSDIGLGGSLIGRFNKDGFTTDAGVHFLGQFKAITLILVPSFNLENTDIRIVFGTLRFRPAINETIKLYSSFENTSVYLVTDHLTSTQRMRLGLEYSGFQMGFAANMSQLSSPFLPELFWYHENYGVFVRKEF